MRALSLLYGLDIEIKCICRWNFFEYLTGELSFMWFPYPEGKDILSLQVKHIHYFVID